MVYRRTERADRVRDAARQKILRAAQELFSSHGYEATTIQDIVRRAGTSVGNLYFYFSNKEELLLHVARAVLDRSLHRMNAAIASVPVGPERLVVAEYTRSQLLHRLGSLAIDGFTTAGPVVRELATRIYLERSNLFLAENAPWLTAEERDVASIAWLGARLRVQYEELLGRDLMPEGERCWLMTRWHLRGIGFPSDEVDAAIAAVRARLPALDALLAWDDEPRSSPSYAAD
jgi:AcrR family transcriptional regulator